MAAAAADVLDIADHLELDNFSVVGRSGGGPHALACAALHRRANAVRGAAVLVGLAPSDAQGLDWFEGMTDSNTNEYEMAAASGDAVVADLTRRAEEVSRNPDSLLHALETEMSAADRRIVSDVGIRRQLLDTYREALKFGPYGWIDDVLAFRCPWGFDLARSRFRSCCGTGTRTYSRRRSTRSGWPSQIPGATIELQRGAAHFGAMEILPQVLARLKNESLQAPR